MWYHRGLCCRYWGLSYGLDHFYSIHVCVGSSLTSFGVCGRRSWPVCSWHWKFLFKLYVGQVDFSTVVLQTHVDKRPLTLRHHTRKLVNDYVFLSLPVSLSIPSDESARSKQESSGLVIYTFYDLIQLIFARSYRFICILALIGRHVFVDEKLCIDFDYTGSRIVF